jgi:hypothetical protein
MCDYGNQQHVGYYTSISEDPNYAFLWSPQRLQLIQSKITQLLEGVHPENRPILVPIPTISSVMSSLYHARRPGIGDIYSIAIQPQDRDDIRDIIDQTINVIVSQIRNEYKTREMNSKLTVWNSLLGDFNTQGIRSHSQIKVNNRRPKLQFVWNY